VGSMAIKELAKILMALRELGIIYVDECFNVLG